jgi:hypothetical protein
MKYRFWQRRFRAAFVSGLLGAKSGYMVLDRDDPVAFYDDVHDARDAARDANRRGYLKGHAL